MKPSPFKTRRSVRLCSLCAVCSVFPLCSMLCVPFVQYALCSLCAVCSVFPLCSMLRVPFVQYASCSLCVLGGDVLFVYAGFQRRTRFGAAGGSSGRESGA